MELLCDCPGFDGNSPCNNLATQEDGLCDGCRNKPCWIGSCRTVHPGRNCRDREPAILQAHPNFNI